ncbi:hypothetical protein JKF63_07373 [Porcisia hertigi]|uniref:Uncharacterized protein n=1 Tax=Porcisia hertigi TaxID=2761500 RepID=A0A836YHN7_9TRYP|nr:hypothetical protein JKF63_07373 [Porcisia hertigi]
MTSREALPYAVALAQEMETELRHLGSLQQHYAQLLIHQLSAFDFIDGAYPVPVAAAAAPAAAAAHSPPRAAAKPKVAVFTACTTQPSALPASERYHVHKAQRTLQTPRQHRGRTGATPIKGSSSSLPRPLVATRELPPSPSPPPPRFSQETKREGQRTETSVTPRPYSGTTSPAWRQRHTRVAVASAVPFASEDELKRRAQLALRLIREDRDAYFNAKARRAEELLREGREAVQRSRARRQAGMAQPLPLNSG